MAIQRQVFDVLMIDGTEHSGVVVTTADTIKLSRTARTHKWDLDGTAGQMEGSVFLVWHALHRRGEYQGSYDQFIDACEVVAPHGDPEDVDPTNRAILSA